MINDLYDIYLTPININSLPNSLEFQTTLSLDNNLNISLTLFKYPRVGFIYNKRVMALTEGKYSLFNNNLYAIKYDSLGLITVAVKVQEASNEG